MSKSLRILVAMPETAGDVFIMTGVVKGIKKQFPNSNIYFATKKEYFDILKGNPDIANVVEFHPSMDNYREYEKWGPADNLFDLTYRPYARTQRIPDWIRSGHGPFLGDAYAHACDVEFGEQHIEVDNNLSGFGLPEKFITVHSQTRTGPKDYDYMQDVVSRITNIHIVQVGGAGDRKLQGVAIDLRGRTTPQQLAGVMFRSELHLGLDSFPLHIAAHVGCPVVAIFGGTYAKQGINPRRAELVRAIETGDRGLCVTSCHLLECEAQKHGFDKCINNIPVEQVLTEVGKVIGEDKIVPPEPIKLSAYIIIKDGIKYEFPLEKCIEAATKVADEVVVVDGGSTDGTREKLWQLSEKYLIPAPRKYVNCYGRLLDDASLICGSGFSDIQCSQCKRKYRIGSGDFIYPTDLRCECGNVYSIKGVRGGKTSKVRIFEHPWDMNNPTLMGDEKTYARKQCTGNYVIQLDADEIIQEPYPGAIIDTIRKYPAVDVLDLPCINFYGDTNTVRVEQNMWKWRISKNDPNIIHGVHGKARIFDEETMQVTMDKLKTSDSCEIIYNDSLEIAQHKPVFPVKYLWKHEMMKAGKLNPKQYSEMLKEIVETCPVVFHYSWLDTGRKLHNCDFWQTTWHGKRNITHNTTADITERLSHPEQEMLVKIDFEHPLK